MGLVPFPRRRVISLLRLVVKIPIYNGCDKHRHIFLFSNLSISLSASFPRYQICMITLAIRIANLVKLTRGIYRLAMYDILKELRVHAINVLSKENDIG